jgi:hypothetical protein
MRRVVDSVLIKIFGQINRLAFTVSRGRVIFYRSFGFPGRVLTVVGPQGGSGTSLLVSCLPYQAGYIVMVGDKEEAVLREALSTCVTASMEFGDDWIPVDVSVLSDQDEQRSILLKQLLRNASISERHEVVQRHLVPLARISFRNRPANDVLDAFSGA